jgi:hypothetical protein
MSRHSSDVFQEIIIHARLCEENSRAGLYEIAKISLSRIQSLLQEAEKRLRFESDCKTAAQQRVQLTDGGLAQTDGDSRPAAIGN